MRHLMGSAGCRAARLKSQSAKLTACYRIGAIICSPRSRPSTVSVFPASTFLSTLNPIEPPWYGPVCPVVWEGWRREASPYPDLRRNLVVPARSGEGLLTILIADLRHRAVESVGLLSSRPMR